MIVTLGDVSRRNVLKALGLPASAAPAGHGVEADVGPYRLINSYHCSRLNTNTGRLTPAMFEDVFKRARQALDRHELTAAPGTRIRPSPFMFR